jgi:N utilization substance protein A
MTVLKYDIALIGYMNQFKKTTGVDAKDCFVLDDVIIFITEPGKAGLAIGKGGNNIIALKNGLKKNIKIIEAADSPENLVANFVYPLQPTKIFIEEKDGKKLINIQFGASRERRMLLSESQTKLKQLKAIVHRYYPDIDNILVLQ